MKKGNIFWGVLLLTLGILFALRNFNIFFFSWGSIFRLWPLIFIFWGIAILPVKSLIKWILTIGTIALAIIILVNHPGQRGQWFQWWPDNYTYRYDRDYSDDEEYEEYDEYEWQEQYLSESYDSSTTYAKMNIDAAAGKFYIRNTSFELFEFESEGDAGPYEIKTTQGDNITSVDIKHKNRYFRSGDIKNDVWLSLNPDPVWKLYIDVGAAGLEMDLTPFKMEKIDIDGGASKIELKLGNLNKKTNVIIDAGASAIEIKVPSGSAVELETSTVLSSRNIEGFNKIKNGLYQTPNFSDSVNQVFIEVDAAVSSIKVERY